MNEPTRLRDDPNISQALRDALDAGRAELPSEAQLASVLAKIGPLIGPGGGGGGGAGAGGAAAGGAGALKTVAGLLAAGVVVGVVVTGAVLLSRDETGPSPRASPVSHVPVLDSPVVDPEPLPVGVEPPDEPVPSASREPRSFEVDPRAEATLLREARAAVHSRPAHALSLATQHARRFGDGTLGQEREVVAIEALIHLERREAAEARAARFYRRWPDSAHARRVRVIVAR